MKKDKKKRIRKKTSKSKINSFFKKLFLEVIDLSPSDYIILVGIFLRKFNILD